MPGPMGGPGRHGPGGHGFGGHGPMGGGPGGPMGGHRGGPPPHHHGGFVGFRGFGGYHRRPRGPYYRSGCLGGCLTLLLGCGGIIALIVLAIALIF